MLFFEELRGFAHVRCPEARICRPVGAREGRSRRVLRRGAEIRHRRPQVAGAGRRACASDRNKQKRKEGEGRPAATKLPPAAATPAGVDGAWGAREAVAEGVVIARDLVNDPPNVLAPEEFARRTAALKKLGVDV